MAGLFANGSADAAPAPPRAVGPAGPAAVDPSVAGTVWQGWGTSLAWWAKVAGGYPEPGRSRLMDRVFDPKIGLGLNVVRYDIGGGEAPDRHTLQFRAAVPGFEPKPGVWDWSADANQRWVLKAAIARGADHVEAFSNSPPYWMTASGSVSGGRDGAENLRPDQFDAFADYLATVTAHFKAADGVTFESLDPLNEPCSRWWTYGKWQEGCRFDRPAQQRMIRRTADALRTRGLPTVVSASDENSIDDAVTSFASLPDPARAAVGRINTHTYGGTGRVRLNLLARTAGKPLWVSEYGDGQPSGLAMADKIVADLRSLQPSAWVGWQVADNGGGWGLFYSRLDDEADDHWRTNKKYFVMAQFSRFVRPGCRLVPVADRHAIAAFDAAARTLTIVAVNSGTAEDDRAYDLTAFTIVAPSAAVTLTSPTADLAAQPPAAVAGRVLRWTLPARSVATFVVTGATYAGPPGYDPAAAYDLTTAAGKVLTTAGHGGVVARSATTAPGWGVLRVGGDAVLFDRTDGSVLDVAAASRDPGGTVIRYPDEMRPNQRWTLRPNADGTTAIVNVNSGLPLDGTADGVVQSDPSDAAGQRWRIVRRP